MSNRVLPKEMQTASVKNEVVARVENNSLGVCPICHVGMRTLVCNDITCYVCLDHRIALPTEDK